MRSFIVGTAGHIDHGKSSLVRALTGTDPDRLKEEKARGITIDLGFAHAELPGGGVASFIDVPGHERFVRNMLAGAHGIDAVMLVVAADESVMPQTREHFHICRLLGVQAGLVALTKCDQADADSQALAELEVRELGAGSFLDGAPVLRVSARSGAGLDQLRAALAGLLARVAPRPDRGLTRLPLDRVFTLRGFGTVATGTLVSGTLAVGDEVEAYPSGRRARVRGLHVHGQAVEQAGAGTRSAVNLSGVELAELQRGDVLARPDTLCVSSLLDVEVAPLPGQDLGDQARVRVHVASAEVLARVRRVTPARETDTRRAPAAPFLAQLRLERKAVAARGDRLVLRSYSPATTVAGARVLDPGPPKRKRSAQSEAVLAALREAPDARAAARVMVVEAGLAGVPALALAARLALPLDALRAELEGEDELMALGGGAGVYVARAAIRQRAEAVLAHLDRFHAREPLKAALGREELRRSLFAEAPDGMFERVLADLDAAGRVRVTPEAVALAGHSVTLTPAEHSAREALLKAAEAAGFKGVEAPHDAAPGADRRVVERVVRLLLSEGELQRVGDGLLLHRPRLEALKQEVRLRWPPGSRLDVGALKDLTGLSRKFVIPLLEYLDRERVTRRAGSDRVVLS